MQSKLPIGAMNRKVEFKEKDIMQSYSVPTMSSTTKSTTNSRTRKELYVHS